MITALPGSSLKTTKEGALDRLAVRGYLSRFASAFERARETTGLVPHDIRLGGALVRLRFAGPALVPFVLPALAHLRTEAIDEPPRLTVDIWDAASTGVFPPPFPVRGEDAPAGGEVRYYDGARVRAVFPSGVRPEDGAFGAIIVYDEETSVAQYFVTRPDQIRSHERAAPLRPLLDWALSGSDRLLVHAGAVGLDGKGVLLTGRGGSGKSTSAVAATLAGHEYLGDDYVLIDLAGLAPVVHSLYVTAKLSQESADLLSYQSKIFERKAASYGEKLVFDISQLRRGGFEHSARVIAIVVPVVRAGGPTGLHRISAGAALQALAPSTIFQAPRRDGTTFSPLVRLARSVPAYSLELGGAPGEVGPVLSELLGDGKRR